MQAPLTSRPPRAQHKVAMAVAAGMTVAEGSDYLQMPRKVFAAHWRAFAEEHRLTRQELVAYGEACPDEAALRAMVRNLYRYGQPTEYGQPTAK